MQDNSQQPTQPQGSPPPNQAPATPPPLYPPQQGDYLHPIADGPKKTYHPKRMIIILSAVVAVSLIIVGILVAYASRPSKLSTEQSQPSQTNNTPQNSDTLTSSDMLTFVQTGLTNPATAKQPITLPVIAPTKKFYTVIPDDTPVQGTVAAVAPESFTSVFDSTRKKFDEKKFTASERRDIKDPAGYLAYFTRDDVICQMTIAPVVAETKTRALEVDCTDIAHYTEYADAQQPLVSLYTPATAASTYVAFTGKPAVKPSQTAGFATVEIPVSTVIDQKLTSTGSLALFYQTPDSLWHYFLDRDTSVLVDCSKYKTAEVLRAYAGTTCSVANSSKTNVVTAPKSSSR